MGTLAAACGTSGPAQSPVTVTAVEPARGPSQTAVEVAISGTGFALPLSVNLDDDTTMVDLPTLQLGDYELAAVAWISEQQLTAQVPTTVPVGSFPLTVTFSDGRTATLPEAYQVVGPSLEFTSPAQLLRAGACSEAITVELQNGFGGTLVAQSDLELTVTSDSPAIQLYADADCSSTHSQLGITAGTSSASLYLEGTSAGAYQLTATAADTTTATQPLTIRPAAAAELLFDTAPQMLPMCQCSAAALLTVSDAFGNRTTVTIATPIALSGNTNTLEFFQDPECGVTTAQTTLAAEADTAEFYFYDAFAEAPVITATAAGLTAASQSATITMSPLSTWYADADGDNFGISETTVSACARPPGYASQAGDCDDNPAACGGDCFPDNPAADICDGYDQDCDDTTDEDPDLIWHQDADGDGYGAPLNIIAQCTQPAGYTDNALDCADNPTDDTVCGDGPGDQCNPLQVEGPPMSGTCADGADNDCDGATDEADSNCTCAGDCGSCSSGCCANPCTGGDCALACDGPCACHNDCKNNSGHCQTDCTGTTCYVDCSNTTGACDTHCHAGSSCVVDCIDAVNCSNSSCDAGADCTFDCSGATNCDVDCTGGATCLLNCAGAAHCDFDSCDGALTSCGGGLLACNRTCP